MIKIQDLPKQNEKFLAVDHLNLTIKTGEFFGLLGPNGAGKTTTISMLSTLLLPTKGSIQIDGEPLTRKNDRLKRKLSVVTQEYSMRQDMTMDEIMEYQGRLYYMPLKKIRERSEELLDFCGLLDYRKRTVRKLSGGMKRKLMVCRALLTEPEILLLDEPLSALDGVIKESIKAKIREIAREYHLTTVIVTHDPEEALTLSNHVMIINKGSISQFGTPDEIVNTPKNDFVEKFILQQLEIKRNNIYTLFESPELITGVGA